MSAQRKHFFIHQTQIDAPVEKLWAAIASPEGIARHCPRWVETKFEAESPRFEAGNCFVFTLKGAGLLGGTWKGIISTLRNHFLIGIELRHKRLGDWKLWTKCLPGKNHGECILEDRIEFNSNFLGGSSRRAIVKAIKPLIHCRQQSIKKDLQLFMALGAPKKPLKCVLAGGRGLVGQNLARLLRFRGHEVEYLSTRQDSSYQFWNPEKGILDPDFLESKDVVVNLSGYPIACRWTQKNSQRILKSRTESTHLLVKTINRLNHPPSKFIQISATGYYGYQELESPATEETSLGRGFLAEVCNEWEKEIPNLKSVPNPKVARLGVVLSAEGGALRKMLPVFRLGLGGPLGGGKQGFSWVSMDEACSALLFLIEKDTQEPVVNIVSDEIATNASFTKALGHVLAVPAVFPVPSFMLKMLYGQMANEALLGGVQVIPEVLEKLGYPFREQSLENSLRNVLGRFVQ